MTNTEATTVGYSGQWAIKRTPAGAYFGRQINTGELTAWATTYEEALELVHTKQREAQVARDEADLGPDLGGSPMTGAETLRSDLDRVKRPGESDEAAYWRVFGGDEAPIVPTCSGAELDLETRDFDPPKAQRVSRCRRCEIGYTWKGSAAQPGCPRCGGTIGTSTRRLKVGFVLLAGDDLANAERVPGGLPDAIAWHEKRAERAETRARDLRAELERGDAELDEDGETIWQMREASDWEIERGQAKPGERRRQSGMNPRYLDESAERHRAKAAKYQRRLEKLGGPINVDGSPVEVPIVETSAGADVDWDHRANLGGPDVPASAAEMAGADVDADLIVLEHHGSAYGLASGELIQYPLEAGGGPVDRSGGGAVDFERGLETQMEVEELRAVELALAHRAAGNVRLAEIARNLYEELGRYVTAAPGFVEVGHVIRRQTYRDALRAYRTDAELEAAERTSKAQDFTDGGGPVDEHGDPIARD